MTKKDYIAIAACIKAEREREQFDMSPNLRIYSVMNSIAVELAKDNPHFDRDKFTKACGF